MSCAEKVMDLLDMPSAKGRDILIAETVMGWQWFLPDKADYYTEEHYPMIFDPSPHLPLRVLTIADSPEKTMRFFEPFTKIRDSFEVVERMKELGFWLQLRSPFFEGQPWFAGFTPHKCTGWNYEPDNLRNGDTASAAICRSAWLTRMRMIEEHNGH